MNRVRSFAIILVLASIPAALSAHHGNALYDTAKPVTVTGTVAGWLWANPHCLLDIDVKDEKGNVVRWEGETSASPLMVNAGWSRRMFKEGDVVTVTMMAAKDGTPIGRISKVVMNGKTFSANGAPPGGKKGDEK
jgi:Family of unknown function (DUF6152)